MGRGVTGTPFEQPGDGGTYLAVPDARASRSGGGEHARRHLHEVTAHADG